MSSASTSGDPLLTIQRFWSLGGQVADADGVATVVRHPSTPDQPLGNFLCRVRTDDISVVDDLLTADADAGLPPIAKVLVDDETPPRILAHLALHDWRLESQLVLALDDPRGVPGPERLVPRHVDGDEAWAAVAALFRIDHLEEDARTGAPPRGEATTLAAVELRRHLGVEVEYHLAGTADEPVGCIAVWVSDAGIGMIEDVFVHPDARGAGVATDLLRFAVGRARDRGAGRIVIGAEVDDTPKHLYHRFGFEPAAVQLTYER